MSQTPRTLSVRQVAGDDRWDALVRRFPNHRVVHTTAWIEYLREAGRGEPLYLVFERDGQAVAALPGLLVTVAGIRLFGSPLPGWQTVSLGPAFDPALVDTAELIGALLPALEERWNVSYVELLHRDLDPAAMTDLGFAGTPVPTYRADLFPGDEVRAFRALDEVARRNIRRAERLKLAIRLQPDEHFVDEHYAQLREVYLRRGTTIPFAKIRVHECFRRMRESGSLVAAAAYLPGGGPSIATGMFLIEGKELLLWTWAHDPRYRWYRPTELLTWTVMRRAMDLGCLTFDLMGRGEFKEKFGAALDQSKRRWIRSRYAWLRTARRVAEAGFRYQQAVRGRTVRAARLAAGALGGRSRSGNGPAWVIGDADLVRALGLGAIRSVVIAPEGAPSRYSRFTSRSLPWIDPADRPEMLADLLVAAAARQPEPPVLFYQDDASLLLVSRQRERLAEAFRFVIPSEALVEDLVDKSRFQELAGRLDLPVPPARAFAPAEMACPVDPELPFPLVLKPFTRRPARWEPIVGRCKAVRVDTLEELRRVWPRLAAGRLSVLAQTLIPGPESVIVSYHAYLDEGGRTVAEFTGRKIRTAPVEFGDSSAVEITDDADVAKLGRDILRRLRLRGVAKLDFKRAPDGRLHLLEVNPRFTLWHHPAAVAGVNIPAMVYRDLVGRRREPAPAARPGVRWCRPWTDWRSARAAGTPLLSWIWWALGCEAKSAIAWDDPLPVFRAVAARRLARSRARSELAGPASVPEPAAPAGGR